MMPPVRVIDSWALLAWLRREPSAPRVREILTAAELGQAKLLMSWINAGEVYYMLVRKNNAKAAEEYLEHLPSLPIAS